MCQKVNRMPFFFRFFTKKSILSCPYFVKKSILSKDTALMSIICEKKVHSPKNTMFPCHFSSSIFKTKNHLLPCPYLIQKTSIFSKQFILWAKKVKSMPFFPIFHEKIYSLMPIFCQQNVHSLKKTML